MSADSFEGTRKDLNRAIRRLGILEWVMLAAAAALALAGGWLTAWLLQGWGFPFRVTWTLASVLLFGIPGVKVLLNENRDHSLDPPETDG